VGRVLTFADADIIKLAQTDLIPVAADDWYQRRREDAEGQFFRTVADQGPRKGENGSTRQGIYVFTAGGKLLAYRNHHDPDVMKRVIRDGLKAWQKLPEAERAPGAVKVDEKAKADPRFHREPPKDGIILKIFTRILDKEDKGYCHGKCSFPGGDRAAHDHVWLTAEDWHSLVPKKAKKGESFAVPDRLALRLARFHLVDNTRGEPPHWERKDVRSHKLIATVEAVDKSAITLSLEGAVLLATHDDPAKADRGFDVALRGVIHIDAATGRIARFDMVAVGEHWGSGPFTRGARPGRSPLGVAFELATGKDATDRVPPQAARSYRDYLEAER